jgi:hypothetical protein
MGFRIRNRNTSHEKGNRRMNTKQIAIMQLKTMPFVQLYKSHNINMYERKNPKIMLQKMFLSFIKHHAMKVHEKSKGKLHAFLISAHRALEWSASRPGLLIVGKSHAYVLDKILVGPQSQSCTLWRKHSCLSRDSNSNSLIVQPLV